MNFAVPDPGALQRLVEGRCHAPHAILGRHDEAGEAHLRVWLPAATSATIAEGPDLQATPIAGIFEWRGPREHLPRQCRIVWRDAVGREQSGHDPYVFPAELGQQDLYLFNEGTHLRLYEVLGAQWRTHDGIDGIRFAVWAPNAERVSVVGDFNDWDGRRHPCSNLGASGVWSLFVPEVMAGACYKYEIRVRGSGEIKLQADPYAHAFEYRPGTASRIAPRTGHVWTDAAWMEDRARTDAARSPMSIYEVHLGSWQRHPDGHFLDYASLAGRLADRALELGFTHIELMPVTEHPFDGSWGYQTLGYFAPTSRFGPPDAFRAFVDHLHGRGIGVILDWVPAHFPRDAHGLARFDGSALYEHEDPRLGEHRDWNTLIFNYGRNEVRSFLLSSALYWLDEFHIDGLRVDAVASMLYLDYSREPGEWLPNRFGGRENLEAIELVRRLNAAVHQHVPGAVTIAEESTSWPRVTGPIDEGGLGFTFKWNMGWMNDTLRYLRSDPIHRRYHHDRLTFGMLYAFSERFVLPLSHDEVVHGKSSLLGKMPGDDWQKFANLRLLFAYQWTLPGKKLLFMGGEFGQWREWDHDGALDWLLLEHAPHETLERLVCDLNRLYRTERALGNDLDWKGFEWLDCEDALRSVLCYARRDGDDEIVVALNFTPVPRQGYRVGVRDAGRWEEVLNTDSVFYGGSNLGNQGGMAARHVGAMGRPFSLEVTLPPLAAVLLRRARAVPRHP